MIPIVVDTNIIVSGMWSRNGAPAKIVDGIMSNVYRVCYDGRINAEYKEVLLRPKFNFNPRDIEKLLDYICLKGLLVAPTRLNNVIMPDECDRMFLEVARYLRVPLITGNLKHFPNDSLVMSVNTFLEFQSDTFPMP